MTQHRHRKRTLIDELTGRYPASAREELFAQVLCGEVYVNGERVRDSKRKVTSSCDIQFRPIRRYVSRGGIKLEHALSRFALEPIGLTIIDAGSSTGGFTDCLLQRRAAHVYAVDVGRNLLSYRLRNDSRVTVLEGTNILDLDKTQISGTVDAAVVDVSFRSILRIPSRLLSFTAGGWVLALVKPQFEWRNPDQCFRGVITSKLTRRAILTELIESLREESVCVGAIEPSPITGRRGNKEFFFLLFADSGAAHPDLTARIDEVL